MENSSIIIYQTEDGNVKIETRLEWETIWLTQEKIALLFGIDRTVITKHLKNIYESGELNELWTSAKIAQVQKEGNREIKREIKYYNLDAILSVGYRVNSAQATQFRQWATARLKEYIVKGFSMNDELLKQAGGGSYFDELLARIRDIRSSEKVFWRKVLDIYATSIDYDPKTETSLQFFQTIQNKMHWAAHGHTAAEIIYERIDAHKPHMGLISFKWNKPTKQETEIAKNYLDKDELNVLNRMVTAYLELAEIQAMNRNPMYMKDWIIRLDEFLKMTGRDILKHTGNISHEQAIDKAKEEYEKFKELHKNELSQVEEHFMESLEAKVKRIGTK